MPLLPPIPSTAPKLFLTTPSVSIDGNRNTIQVPDGPLYNGKISDVYFNGNKAIKVFTVESLGPGAVTFTLNLSTQGPFNLIPGSGASATFTIPEKGGRASFIVSYDTNSHPSSPTSTRLTSSVPIYSLSSTDPDPIVSPDSPVVMDSTRGIDFLVNRQRSVSTRSLGPILNVGSDGNPMIEQASSKITQDETSFGLIRTNPKLTGNVKITVDSSEEIWLNSIDAEKELADDRFKKYRISPDSSYAIDINKFFDYGQTPSEIVFSLYQKDETYLSTKKTFDDQYDNFYQYGASQLPSKFYDEDFSFFAPLYLKKEIPEYFVIFRTTGPINKFTYETSFNEWKNHVSSEILANSQIIKVFDLTSNSKIGKYLRNIVDHPARKDSEITVSYQQNGYTTFNGVSYKNGTYVQAGELLYDYIEDENPLLNVEEFVTLGFQRNNVLSSHVINLEFLFNDDDAEAYGINRYFGLYVNSIDLATFTLSAEALTDFSFDIGQTPLPRKGIDGTKVSQKSFIQTNSDGIKIYVDSESIESYPKINKYAFTSKVDKMGQTVGSFWVRLPGKFDNKLNIGETIKFDNGTIQATARLTNYSYSIVDDKDTTTLFLSKSSFSSTTTLDIFLQLQNFSVDFYTEDKLKKFEKRIFDNSFIEKAPRLFYLKDNRNLLNSVSSTDIKYVNIDPFTRKEVVEVSLKDIKIDIANFSGFSSLLTQTESKLLSKGRSSLSIEVKDFFSPNDYIEISWQPGPTSGGYPLRWRVVANNNNMNPGEAWPSYTVTNDSEGDYYLSYFHPGNSTIKKEDFVKSIQDAFNKFPFKDFEVLAKGTNLHFRSTQDDRVSESARLKFRNSVSDSIYVMGIPGGVEGSVNFIGASNKNKTRARVPKAVAEGMLIDEYISTKGSFSENRRYNILGSTIVFSPYLDEPVYDEDGEKLVDFIDSDNYRVISLEKEDAEIQITSDDKVTTYELFKPKFGILSVLPIKDFDTDFYTSDYTRSYSPELLKYFERFLPPVKITGILNNQYTFNSNVNIGASLLRPITTPFLLLSDDGTSDPILFNKEAQFKFIDNGNTAELVLGDILPKTLSVGNTILFLPFDSHLYFTEDILSKFKGFLTLSSIVSAQDERDFEILQNLWDPSRFNPELNSEYDRMGENYLKTLVLKSRVVPYSMKWVSPQGRDVRDNPYRFNYHRSFGNMSFSPSENLQSPNPIFFTHEWPYLDSIPIDFPIFRYPESTFSYFFQDLKSLYDFKSLSRDWFSQYFSVGYPIEKAWNGIGIGARLQPVEIDPFERYSYFNYEDFSESTFTFFRGHRFQIFEKDSQGNTVLNSKKYNNYRFSAIIKTEEENTLSYEDPIEFKTIVNEKWKFILLQITLRTGSYRFPFGNVRYTDLYTFQSSLDKTYYLYDTSSVPGTDYTLPGFSQVTPSDKRLSSPINLEYYTSDPNLPAYGYYDMYPSSDVYIDNLASQVLPTTSGEFSNLVAYYKAGDYEICATIPVPESVYDLNTIEILGASGFIKIGIVNTVISVPLPYSSVSWQDYLFFHEGGGNNTMQDFSERLSFLEINKVINGTSERAKMVYEIYKEDGTVIDTPNFTINSVSPESLTRIFDYYPVSDPDKPTEFRNIENIGVVLEEQKDLQTIYRYQGDFSPKFRDVLKFWLREDEEFTTVASRDFLFCNTHFAEELKDFSILKNQFYNKVADSEILTLSPDSGYSPVYPLINEIAIDKKDVFAWNSSWDQSYYRKYANTSAFQEIRGTEEMKEVKSLFGSKLMNVPDQYDLYQFKLQKFESSAALEASNSEFGYYQTPTEVIIQINVYDRLLREMLGSGSDLRAKKEFLKVATEIPSAMSISTVEQKARQYLIDNIIDLFEIDIVKLYVLQTGAAAEGLIATAASAIPISVRPTVEFNTTSGENITFDENQLRNGKYIMKKDVKITQLSSMKFQINYPLDSRYYTSLSAGVAVKRI